ncbi:MAG TPA: hypothetical protein VFC51_18625 [Chloroflexota bacterium]|nr:hypothetical protein [Chloroflexota bacterium]
MYQQMRKIEVEVLGTLDSTKQFFFFGNAPGMAWVPTGLIVSACHWYAVSACNYVRLVGWLGTTENPKLAGEYVKRVMPEVHLWRNKVAAHFARTSPRKEDTVADLISSVMLPISFDDDRYFVGSLTFATQGSSAHQGMRWSLTETHEALRERYWPNPPTRPSEPTEVQ